MQITSLCYSLLSNLYFYYRFLFFNLILLLSKAPKPECEAVCEDARCDWKCSKPECPKPKCELVCENPNCKPKVACCLCEGLGAGVTP